MTPYQILGIREWATKQEATNAYRKLAKRWHPDLCQDPIASDRMKEINRAYDLIMKGYEPQPVIFQSPVVWYATSFSSADTTTGTYF